jgi:hypothetical protein
MTTNFSRRTAFLALWASATELLLPVQAHAALRRVRLFFIARSKNKNVVCYDLLIPQTPGSEPTIDVYWEMAAKSGQREELTGLERARAYGYRTLGKNSRGELTISLLAAPQRPLTITSTSARPEARVVINKAPAQLESIYVQTREGGLIPKVLYVDLRGRRESGQTTSERIEP